MVTREDIDKAIVLISQARYFVAKLDRAASATEVQRVNQTFAHLEKAEYFISKLKK